MPTRHIPGPTVYLYAAGNELCGISRFIAYVIGDPKNTNAKPPRTSVTESTLIFRREPRVVKLPKSTGVVETDRCIKARFLRGKSIFRNKVELLSLFTLSE